MPFTPTHVVAILPLWPLRRFLPFTALAIGAMVDGVVQPTDEGSPPGGPFTRLGRGPNMASFACDAEYTSVRKAKDHAAKRQNL